MSAQATVLFVNEAFYDAFRKRDLETMDQLWARDHPVACVHPGWQAITEREMVMESWSGIFSNPGSPEVFCHNAEAFVTGDCVFVVCYEAIDGNVLVATNIFIAEAGQWKLVHHHAGPCNLQAETLVENDDDGPVQ